MPLIQWDLKKQITIIRELEWKVKYVALLAKLLLLLLLLLMLKKIYKTLMILSKKKKRTVYDVKISNFEKNYFAVSDYNKFWVEYLMQW